MELGLYTFADVDPDQPTREPRGAGVWPISWRRSSLPIRWASTFSASATSPPDYAASAPAVISRAAAHAPAASATSASRVELRRSRPRLPAIRHLDLLSNGRAEVMPDGGSSSNHSRSSASR